jgi:hypothetical protein
MNGGLRGSTLLAPVAPMDFTELRVRYLRIQLENVHDYQDALKYIASLPFEAVRFATAVAGILSLPAPYSCQGTIPAGDGPYFAAVLAFDVAHAPLSTGHADWNGLPCRRGTRWRCTARSS